jgi:hypothetical protein
VGNHRAHHADTPYGPKHQTRLLGQKFGTKSPSCLQFSVQSRDETADLRVINTNRNNAAVRFATRNRANVHTRQAVQF